MRYVCLSLSSHAEEMHVCLRKSTPTVPGAMLELSVLYSARKMIMADVDGLASQDKHFLRPQILSVALCSAENSLANSSELLTTAVASGCLSWKRRNQR